MTHLKNCPPVCTSGVVEVPEDGNAADIHAMLGLGSDDLDDSFCDQAVAIVATDREFSTSHFQRKLGITYNKAPKLAEHSVITAANNVGKREKLVEES